MSGYSSGVTRGCGKRVAGGVYVEVPTGPNGRPIEHFIVDAPVPVPTEMAMQVRGMNLIERAGVWHLVDHVGAAYYPNVADIIEEVRAFGVSRRVQANLDFSRLTAESKLLLVHPRAIVVNDRDYRPDGREYDCPKAACEDCTIPNGHQDGSKFCAGVWWEDITGGEKDELVPNPRAVWRTIGDTSYQGWTRPEGVEPRYELGIVMSVPIGRIAVVEDPKTGSHVQTLAAVAAKTSVLEVALVSE